MNRTQRLRRRAEDELRKAIDRAWPVLAKLGLRPGASRERLRFTADPAEAAGRADFVYLAGDKAKAPTSGQAGQVFKAIAASKDGLTLSEVYDEVLSNGFKSKSSNPESCVAWYVSRLKKTGAIEVSV